MDYYEPEVRQLEKQVAASAMADPVVFYGSSTIRLWTNLAEDLSSPRILNLGFGGSTLQACAYFFRRLVVPARPCSLVVYAGDNDLGDGQSPSDVLASYQNLSQQARVMLPGASLTFISIKPSPARAGILKRIQRANAMIQEVLSQRNDCYFIDVFADMLTREGTPRRDLFELDGLHMNRAGYELWITILKAHWNLIFTDACTPMSVGIVS